MKSFEVELTNNDSQDVPFSFAKEIANLVGENLYKEGLLDEDCFLAVSVAFVGQEKMKKLNSEYRKVEESTDVLSFCYEKKHDKIEGEIILCWPTIKKYAQIDKKDEKEELKKNIAHGFLHILDFEHGDRMFELQKLLINKNSK